MANIKNNSVSSSVCSKQNFWLNKKAQKQMKTIDLLINKSPKLIINVFAHPFACYCSILINVVLYQPYFLVNNHPLR